jgi:hypothetical protein
MPRVAPSPVGREAGRGLLTLANLITAVAPVAADWNDSHIFNRRWPSHARFHGVVALAMTSSLAGLNLWSLWSETTDRRTSRLFAAAVPVGYWAPFLLAPLVPGTGVDDPPHPIPRVAGVPTSLLGAAATTVTAVAGWLLDRRWSPGPSGSRRSRPPPAVGCRSRSRSPRPRPSRPRPGRPGRAGRGRPAGSPPPAR